MANLPLFGSGVSGAVSELFSGFASEKKGDMYRLQSDADILKGIGAAYEGMSYSRAGDLARLNADFTARSTAIQAAQSDRQVYMSLGSQRAGYGASGLAESGSAIDVLRGSAQQGALERSVLLQQGVITEEGYREQAEVYGNMVEASKVAVEGSRIASQQHKLAAEAEDNAAIGHYIGGAIKGVTAVASLFAGGGLSMPGLNPLADSI